VPRKILRFAASLLLVAAIVAIYRAIPHANNTTVALTLLLAILGISTWWGLAEATLASVAAVLGFNFYFLPPVGTFTIQEPQNQIVFVAFLVTAATASQLSARARRRTAEAEARRLEIQRLYDLVQTTMLTGDPRKTIREFVQKIVQVFQCQGAAFYYRHTDEIFRSGPETKPIADHDLHAAAEISDPSSDLTRNIATAPVRLGGRTLGSMALIGPLPTGPMVGAIANLLAISIEKARALEDASHAEAARQSEVLKAALLDALAHDIKTPLTSIKAAVTGLISNPGAPDRELLTIIDEEADRLNQLAAEVIAMSRIEAGKLHLEKQPVDPEELLANVLADLRPALHGRAIDVRLQPALPPADADPEFIQQVVKQLVENAVKYTPASSPITLSAVQNNGKIVIGVVDTGPGIEENERALIFDKFFRGRRHRFETKGTGMGLAIAKGIVEAHRERIWVESEPGQGSAFYFTLAPYRGRNL
jgi:two-component system, OmpR family, sensor histidine kinase KdpD